MTTLETLRTEVKNNFYSIPYPVLKYCHPNIKTSMSLKRRGVTQRFVMISHCHHIYNMPNEKTILGTQLHTFIFNLQEEN